MDYVHDLGDLKLNMSGCINACSHHHVGHIGILGVDKKGEDWYQITLGGDDGSDAALGKVMGKSVASDEVADTLQKVIEVFVEQRLKMSALSTHSTALEWHHLRSTYMPLLINRKVVEDNWTLINDDAFSEGRRCSGR